MRPSASLLAATALLVTACGSGGTKTVTQTVSAPPAAGTLATTTTTAAAATEVRIFTPVSPSATPMIKITKTADGRCWEGSLVAPRREAWRCFLGNYIEDPCFTAGYEDVICPTGGPWTGEGVEIRLSEPVSSIPKANESQQPESINPWALELTDGKRCIFASGATSVVDSLRQNYLCPPLGTIWLYGSPKRETAPWTIYSATSSVSQLTATTIRIVWF
jgi:hypothetical protein